MAEWMNSFNELMQPEQDKIRNMFAEMDEDANIEAINEGDTLFFFDATHTVYANREDDYRISYMPDNLPARTFGTEAELRAAMNEIAPATDWTLRSDDL